MKTMLAAPPHTVWEARRGEFLVSTDPARLNLDAVYAYLSRAYWCEGIPRQTVERALRQSLCFSLLEGERQIGLVRVITDYTTFAYLCDVYVLESHQGRGLGTWMMQCVVEHPELQGLRRWHLTTRDAHALYHKVGFVPLSKPERHMEVFTPDIYKVQNSDGGRNHE
jgi:GNAT superfamily N-acetyltransferase